MTCLWGFVWQRFHNGTLVYDTGLEVKGKLYKQQGREIGISMIKRWLVLGAKA